MAELVMRRTKKGGGSPSGMGAPKKSFPVRDLKIVEHFAKLGATQAQIAEFFGVNVQNVEYWMRNVPAFKKAFKKGGIEADIKVAQSLYKRAKGYSYVEEEYSAIEIDGKPVPLHKMARVKRIVKRMPPDVKAAIHWLRLRQREKWSVVPEMLHLHTGKVTHLHKKLQDLPIGELSLEAQKMLFEITSKQLDSESAPLKLKSGSHAQVPIDEDDFIQFEDVNE